MDKILQQYEFSPYPNIPLESVTFDAGALFKYCAATPFYFQSQQVRTESLRILDVGCGTGYKTLLLAAANRGATVKGIDLSPKSISIARERAAHWGREDVTFERMDVNSLGGRDEKYDYINCQDILYLLPNPAEVLNMQITR